MKACIAHGQKIVSHGRQRGAALAVGLILLTILTLLAITGFGTATTELVMAGNEQYRKNASQAASAGVEDVIERIGAVSTVASAPPTVFGPSPVGPAGTDEYVVSVRFAGVETGLPQSSVDKFVGLHFVIESTGTSRRGASETQVQGVFVVAPAAGGGAESYGRLGSGLGP